MINEFEYDVGLSFAGEDRDYVDRVAAALTHLGVHLFYDMYEEVVLWGTNLVDHLDEVYRKKCRLVVMFISTHYALKAWPNHERQSALARAITEKGVYVLPVRFDDSEVPGLQPSIQYMSARDRTPEELADLVARKVVASGGQIRPASGIASSSQVAPRADGPTTTVHVFAPDGRPIHGADLLFIAANGTHVAASTHEDGQVNVRLPERRLVTVFCAHVDWLAHEEREFDPVDDLTVHMGAADHTGSVILSNGLGAIPTLSGTVNPILDTLNRTYLYADNIAVDGGLQQPVPFEVGKPILLEDSKAFRAEVTIVAIIGRASLVQFTEL